MIRLRVGHHYANKHKQYNKTGAFLQTTGVTMNRISFLSELKRQKNKKMNKTKTSKMVCKTTPSTQNKVIKN
jgi:hypothetical protein